MSTVKRFCNRAIWLHDGVIKEDGNLKDGTMNKLIEKYLKETA